MNIICEEYSRIYLDILLFATLCFTSLPTQILGVENYLSWNHFTWEPEKPKLLFPSAAPGSLSRIQKVFVCYGMEGPAATVPSYVLLTSYRKWVLKLQPIC